MISNATPGDAAPDDVVMPSASDMVRDDNAAAAMSNSDTGQHVDLNSAPAWAELVREIVAMASGGGGHIVLRCDADREDQNSAGREFSVRIESTAKPKRTELRLDPQSSGPATLSPVRIVTDPDAPALQPQDVDHLYPWRQKDLLRELNGRLGRRFLNSYDIQAVRRQHHLDDRPDFVFNLPGAGRRYSPAVAEWMMEQHGRDPEFFRHAREADHEIMKLRRQKPK
jgi:hypothetical protein